MPQPVTGPRVDPETADVGWTDTPGPTLGKPFELDCRRSPVSHDGAPNARQVDYRCISWSAARAGLRHFGACLGGAGLSIAKRSRRSCAQGRLFGGRTLPTGGTHKGDRERLLSALCGHPKRQAGWPVLAWRLQGKEFLPFALRFDAGGEVPRIGP